jgi:fumarate hydratase class II
MIATRVELDSLGPVNVPTGKLWGAQTQRSVDCEAFIRSHVYKSQYRKLLI